MKDLYSSSSLASYSTSEDTVEEDIVCWSNNKQYNCWNSTALVVKVPGYRSRGPGSIPGAIRFTDK
jgi:hypothetical protein